MERGEHAPLGREAGLGAGADLTRLGCLPEEDRV